VSAQAARPARPSWVAGSAEDLRSLVWNEFAAVRVTIDHAGLTPRLLIEDVDSGAVVYLDPLELASLANTPDRLRSNWLNVGPYLP
jgi:hypothetical protein